MVENGRKGEKMCKEREEHCSSSCLTFLFSSHSYFSLFFYKIFLSFFLGKQLASFTQRKSFVEQGPDCFFPLQWKICLNHQKNRAKHKQKLKTNVEYNCDMYCVLQSIEWKRKMTSKLWFVGKIWYLETRSKSVHVR